MPLLVDTVPTPDDLQKLPEIWREPPRRWGHPLHSLCSYLAMFPPQLARVVIEWLTRPGGIVYDPFSGRGTVALESVLLRRTAFASDANPLAHVLSQAKINIPSRGQLDARLTELEASCRRTTTSIELVPTRIRMLYSDRTLRQLQFLKESLDRASPVDGFLIATILGMLHANHSKDGATRGFSISMPNTFAMAPGYIQRYIEEHRLHKPDVDVFPMLQRRLDRLRLPEGLPTKGGSWIHDAVDPPPPWLANRTADLVLTSPPYLRVIKYGKYNWVRLWFLGEDARGVDELLMATSSLSRYVEFMRQICLRLTDVVKPDGFICFVIGDVRRRVDGEDTALNLAEAVWSDSAQPLGWHLHGIIADDLPQGHKVSRIWKDNSGRATKTDRLLLMSPRPTRLPVLVRPTWDRPVLDTEGVPA